MVAIRIARIDDAKAIADLTADVQQLHSEALPDIFEPPSDRLFPSEKLVTLLQDPNSTVAVAEINGDVVGYVHCTVTHRAENEFRKPETYVCVQAIGVRKDARRQGVGRALITFMENCAASSGLAGLQVNYWAFKARAQQFFASCGFSPFQVTMRTGGA